MAHTPMDMEANEMSRSKQVPEQTLSDECKWCAHGEPEWSKDAQCYIHRRSDLDKRCLRKQLSPAGEIVRENAFKSMREALLNAQRYIENTESELGITLDSGNAIRAALALADGGDK